MSATDSVSEVARLRERLEKEYASSTLLKAGFAVSANHAAITKRMELFGDCLSKTQEQLTLLIGDAAAEQVVAEVLLKMGHCRAAIDTGCMLGQVSRWLVSLPSIPYLPGVRLCSLIV